MGFHKIPLLTIFILKGYVGRSKDYEINWSYLSYDLEAVGLIEDWNGLLMAKLNWQLRCNNFKRIRHHPPGCSIHLEPKMFI